jgi:hypothetical protein
MHAFSQFESLPDADILVIGAGSAGCMAAVAAAENSGQRVVLVERYGFPGGSSTQMLDTFYGFFTPGEHPKKIVGGQADRVVDLLNGMGEIFLRPNTYGAGTGVNYHPERLKYVWDIMLSTAGVHTVLHTTLIGAEIGNDGRYTCFFWNKEGCWKMIAKRLIDASGDADLCHHLGYGYELAGVHEPAQSMTTTFRMANVDLDVYEKEGGKKKLADIMRSTTMPLPRKEGSAHAMNISGCISTVAVKVSGLSGLKADDLTKAEMEGRKQAFQYEEFFRSSVPGYGQAKIIGLSNQIGVRETRRVFGEKRLIREDCMQASVPDDSIFLCGAPIEDHRQGKEGESETHWEYIPGTGIYGVPYGCIVPAHSDAVWVVGRCFSASHDAHASCRSMAQTMSMGIAAGKAAVQSLENQESARELDLRQLRNSLVESGGILEIPHRTAYTGKDDWQRNK